MKKYLVILAAALVTLASCGGAGSKYTSIKFKNAEKTIALGSTDKLQVLYEPTTLDAPKCVWASSNEAVVTVDQNGNIEALDLGEANITATLGEGEDALQAVCRIIVKDAREMLAWGGMARFSDVTPYDESVTYDVELSDGVYKCQYGTATYYLWDDGVYIDDDGYLSGEGYIFALDSVPVFIIAEEGEYNGATVGSPIYFIDDDFDPTDTTYAYCLKTGSLGDVEDLYAYVMEEEGATYEACFKGPQLIVLYEDNFYYPSFGAIVNAGYIYGSWQEMKLYDFSVTWADEYYGLAIDETGENLKEPLEWATATFNYVLSSNANTQRRVSPKVVAKTGIRATNIQKKAFQTKDVMIKK